MRNRSPSAFPTGARLRMTRLRKSDAHAKKIMRSTLDSS